MLFALVNLARHLDVDAEGALRRTIDKFTRPLRARRGPRAGRARRLDGARPLPLATLDGYWEEAKAKERGGT